MVLEDFPGHRRTILARFWLCLPYRAVCWPGVTPATAACRPLVVGAAALRNPIRPCGARTASWQLPRCA